MIIQTFSTTVMSVLWLPHYMILQFFLTNQEYREKYPEIPLVDIQSAVERPYLYTLGQSTSSDLDQLSLQDWTIFDLCNLLPIITA